MGTPALKRAPEVADPSMKPADLFRQAVRTFVRVRTARRLAALGGAQPGMRDIPRRREMPEQGSGR
ncbi:DUF2191 domain-containing protein [Thiomonas sp. FB-6]|uniref:DUF2191 domain-containing protein n=1 Tax=Thiomonas sp. FB-6 TaxID=1158291 RepID=UPI0009DBAE82|nr:DUF2191 domain-containing protein [Thiomonas sp. FB-6]